MKYELKLTWIKYNCPITSLHGTGEKASLLANCR